MSLKISMKLSGFVIAILFALNLVLFPQPDQEISQLTLGIPFPIDNNTLQLVEEDITISNKITTIIRINNPTKEIQNASLGFPVPGDIEQIIALDLDIMWTRDRYNNEYDNLTDIEKEKYRRRFILDNLDFKVVIKNKAIEPQLLISDQTTDFTFYYLVPIMLKAEETLEVHTENNIVINDFHHSNGATSVDFVFYLESGKRWNRPIDTFSIRKSINCEWVLKSIFAGTINDMFIRQGNNHHNNFMILEPSVAQLFMYEYRLKPDPHSVAIENNSINFRWEFNDVVPEGNFVYDRYIHYAINPLENYAKIIADIESGNFNIHSMRQKLNKDYLRRHYSYHRQYFRSLVVALISNLVDIDNNILDHEYYYETYKDSLHPMIIFCRESLYALYGKRFTNKYMQALFNKFVWYKPVLKEMPENDRELIKVLDSLSNYKKLPGKQE